VQSAKAVKCYSNLKAVNRAEAEADSPRPRSHRPL